MAASTGPGWRFGGPVLYWAVFALVFVVYVLRRPDILLAAQFWGIDGTVWYDDAYRLGPLEALFIPHTGYLQTFSRAVFGVSTLMPLALVPTFANVTGLLVRAATVAFLFTRRFDWVNPWARLVLLVYVLLMPGLNQVHVNVTNTHWYLALYLAMVVVAEPPGHRLWKLHDLAVVVVAGLSGPFVAFLAPVYLLHRLGELRTARRDGTPWSPSLLDLLIFGLAGLQAWVFLVSDGISRRTEDLGVSFVTLVQIVDTRVLLGTLRFFNADPERLASQLPWLVAGFVLATAAFAFVMLRGGWRIRVLLGFAAVSFAATLASPVVDRVPPLWPHLLDGGSRYFVIPRIAVVCAALALAGLLLPQRWRPVAAIAACLVIVAVTARFFMMPPVEDGGFAAAAAAFDAAPPGTKMSIPIAPAGWEMVVTRH